MKELRDFLLNGSKVMRTLLGQLHEITGDLLGVFQEWREWRIRTQGILSGSDRRAYYASDSFGADFMTFIDSQLIAQAGARRTAS